MTAVDAPYGPDRSPQRAGSARVRRTFGSAVVAVAVALTAAGCSDDGSSTSSDGTVDVSDSQIVGTDSSVAGSSGTGDSPGAISPDPEGAGASAVASSTAPTVTPTIAVVADTGVPGLDSTDRFCRAWSEFAGSFQALALASGQGSEPLTTARAEVAAAPVIIASVAALDSELPAELEPERDALTVELVGPMARRADRALAALEAEGISSGQTDALGASWLQALTESGLDDPDISVDVDDELAAILDAAAEDFAASVPSIANDPSLITDASTPLTFEYLAANCPDQGILGGNDIVAQP